jgi:hypothetical protein
MVYVPHQLQDTSLFFVCLVTASYALVYLLPELVRFSPSAWQQAACRLEDRTAGRNSLRPWQPLSTDTAAVDVYDTVDPGESYSGQVEINQDGSGKVCWGLFRS